MKCRIQFLLNMLEFCATKGMSKGFILQYGSGINNQTALQNKELKVLFDYGVRAGFIIENSPARGLYIKNKALDVSVPI